MREQGNIGTFPKGKEKRTRIMTRASLISCVALLLLVGLTVSMAAPADNAAPAGQTPATSQPAAKAHHGHGGGGLWAQLNLTADQKAQIKSIMQQAHKDAKEATSKADKARIHKLAWEKIRTSVLTADQRKKLAELQAARKGQHRAHHKNSTSQPTTATTTT